MTNFKESWMAQFDDAIKTTPLASSTPVIPPVTGAVSDVDDAPDSDDVNDTGVVWTLNGNTQNEGGNSQHIRILTQPFTIGRHPDNTACIPHSTVSGYHAEIVLAGEEILVQTRTVPTVRC